MKKKSLLCLICFYPSINILNLVIKWLTKKMDVKKGLLTPTLSDNTLIYIRIFRVISGISLILIFYIRVIILWFSIYLSLAHTVLLFNFKCLLEYDHMFSFLISRSRLFPIIFLI
uniref:hypothetical protein n=1 Tax=Pappia fissilis TaxID=1040649 RepID=UPI002A8106A2|nr:hypothetical protein UYP79_mgp067 [Pappia fissilis]WOX61269.1 hypothetical protein [Pappia fissilis]